MRSAPVLLTLLVLLSGCTSEPVPGPVAGPSGPCAAARELPPDGSQEQRLQGDLDGDGRADEVVSWVQDGERVVQAWLATGENAAPEALFDGELLAAPDLDGDGRAEVLVGSGEDGAGLALDGCRLAPVTVAGTDRAWTFAVGPDAALVCRPQGLVEEAVTNGPETVRRAWTLSDGSVTVADPVGSGPVTSAGIACP
jgi:hypothetical protein